MKKCSKNGVTLVSLVIYIILFTGLTVFVSVISTNMNKRLFDNRGEAVNYANLNKLQYNLENSSMNSNDVSLDINQIIYSNGDTYVYDEYNNVIYKNGGILCLNVNNFTTTIETNVNIKKVTLNVSFNKYINIMDRTIITCVEGI